MSGLHRSREAVETRSGSADDQALRSSRALVDEKSRNDARRGAARSSKAREMHELGNHMVGVLYCLRQLGGCQRTGELEAVVREGLESCEKSMAAFRSVHKARTRTSRA